MEHKNRIYLSFCFSRFFSLPLGKKNLKIKSSETWICLSTRGICHEEENKSPRFTQIGSDKSLIAYEHFQIVH